MGIVGPAGLDSLYYYFLIGLRGLRARRGFGANLCCTPFVVHYLLWEAIQENKFIEEFSGRSLTGFRLRCIHLNELRKKIRHYQHLLITSLAWIQVDEINRHDFKRVAGFDGHHFRTFLDRWILVCNASTTFLHIVLDVTSHLRPKEPLSRQISFTRSDPKCAIFSCSSV